VTRLRKMMLEELQARKSLPLCLAGLRVQLDPIAEASEVPDHLPSAKFRSSGNRWAPFFVTDALVQD
jgi:hypothetical protein